jgi:hypothetical protein
MAQAAVTERHVRTGSTLASTISEASLPVDGLVRRLGFWSAVAAGVFSIAFAIGTIVGVLLFPPTLWTGDITAFAAKYNPIPMALAVGPSFLIAPAFLGLAVAIHSGARAQRRPLTLLGLLFATIYVTTVGINYFLQLTVVRQNLMAGTTDGIGLFALINFQSVGSALEFLGYFWQGVAALFMAAYFVGPGIGRWTRWMLIAVFASGALGVVAAVRGTTFSDPLFIGGSAVWTLCFPAAMILAALYFRHLRVASHVQ